MTDRSMEYCRYVPKKVGDARAEDQRPGPGTDIETRGQGSETAIITMAE